MSQQDEVSLWLEYKNEQDEHKKLQIRNKLIEKYYPVVEKIAKSLSAKLSRKVLDDELASYGVDGLYIAIDRYDVNRGIQFESFANLRIRGAMLDEIRKIDKVPRSVRMNSHLFEKTKAKLESDKKRLITDYEVMQEIGINSSGNMGDLKNFKPVNTTSLDGLNTTDTDDFNQDCNINLTDEKASNPDSYLKRKEFFNKLLGKDFSELERKIIYMYYYQGFTMDVIATKVKLSESRVSQIHTDLLPKLKDKASRNPNYFSSDISSFIKCSSDLF